MYHLGDAGVACLAWLLLSKNQRAALGTHVMDLETLECLLPFPGFSLLLPEFLNDRLHTLSQQPLQPLELCSGTLQCAS